jgi:hypothetical protein
MSETIQVERALSTTRKAELGIDGWPLWKDGVGDRVLTLDAAEISYLLAGEVVLTLDGQDPVTVVKGDLVILPAGPCRWQVRADVRRHYRSDALSPACCIIA